MLLRPTLSNIGHYLIIMNVRNLFCSILFQIPLLLEYHVMHSQSAQESWIFLIKEDSSEINTLALYPQKFRTSMFKISTHPEAIVKLDVIQKKTKQAFKNLISNFSKTEQEAIWNLSRYDNLFQLLAQPNLNEKEIQSILIDYPETIRDEALFFTTHHHQLLYSLDSIKDEFDISFSIVVSAYPVDDQLAFRNMLKAPEALSILNKNLHMTICLGDLYNLDSVYLRLQFDSLNLILAEQQAREKEDWKQEIANDPDARQELLRSSEEYAKEIGYIEKVSPDLDSDLKEPYDYTPYPYWCAYPWWYEQDYWYPYPLWYQSGFYYRNDVIIWIGPPSWYFIRWHFNRGHHFFNFPHITNLYLNHYYFGHRHFTSRSKVHVRNWIVDHEHLFSRDFTTNKAHRVARLRDFGKAEMDRDKFNKENPGNQKSSEEFIRYHKKDYPNLNPHPDKRTELNPPARHKEKKPDDQPGVTPQRMKDKLDTEPSNRLPDPGKARQKVPGADRQAPARIPKETQVPKPTRENPRTFPKVNPTKPDKPINDQEPVSRKKPE